MEGPTPDDRFDLATVFAHETGHLLGLAHSQDAQSVMDPGAKPGVSRTQLSADDMSGICAVYPPDGTRPTAAGVIAGTACNLAPSGGASSTCAPSVTRACSVGEVGGKGPAGFALAVVATLAMALRARGPKRLAA